MSVHRASKPPFDLTTESSELMPNLRFLSISSQFECFPKRSFQLSNLYYKRLVFLKLSHNGSNQFWNVNPPDEHKRFRKLKILDHSYCENLSKSPKFSWFPSLEHLDFKRCNSLDELDESIGQLSQLKSLILKWCMSLKKLPDSIGELKTIEKLDLSYTRIEELPDSISRMTSLKKLILKSCKSLKKLPDGVGLLEKLEVLDFRWCVTLVKLPRSFGGMRCLKGIQLEEIFITEFHNDFSMPPNLEELEITAMPWLKSLPANISTSKTLKQLKIWECGQLEDLPTLPLYLVELCIERCASLVRLPDLSQLKMLTTLKFKYCGQVEEISGVEKTKSLCELDARGSYNSTHTQRKIIQGTLEPYNRSLAIRYSYSLTADQRIYNGGFILCLVLETLNLTDLHAMSFDIDVLASIHQNNKKIICFHSLTVQESESDSDRDVIYICHFKSFDWFGVPLHENVAIEILDIDAPGCRVKFCEVLFKNGGTQKPRENSNILNWSYVDDDDGGVITLDYWPNQQQTDEAPSGPLQLSLNSRRMTRGRTCPMCEEAYERSYWRRLKGSALRVCNRCYFTSAAKKARKEGEAVPNHQPAALPRTSWKISPLSIIIGQYRGTRPRLMSLSLCFVFLFVCGVFVFKIL